jgi:ABC-2 type transport system ATP-binding protein
VAGAAVEVEGLTRRYSPTAGIEEVTFRAETGSVTAVLGRNGAGKTTTIEICCGLRRRDSGSVRVLGQDPARRTRELAARVAAMPQAGGSGASGVYPSVKVREVVGLFAAQYADPLPAGPLLARLDLDRVASTPWRRLSGGEQQRVSLALALVGRPELVFLDEPSAGLDVHARHTMWELIGDLRRSGVSVVLTTHALDEAEHLADHVVILDAGRVVAAGTPQELTRVAGVPELTFDAPAGLDVQALTAALPDGAVATASPAGGYRVGGRVDPGVIVAVTAWCAQQGVMPDNLTTGTRTLESVFLELTSSDGTP